MAWWDAIAMTLSVHARTDSTGYVRLLWKSNGEADEFSHAAIFTVKFW